MGVPIPDSDYDVRFIYRMPVNDYLRVDPRRDVIETNAQYPLDVNGWDISKALFLMNKGNAVVLEWLQSPIQYIIPHPKVLEELLGFATHAAVTNHFRGMRWHYFKLIQTHIREFGPESGPSIPLKKYFYGVRPALMIDYILTFNQLPPMDLPKLLNRLTLPNGVRSCIDDLVLVKGTTREMGIQGRMPWVDQYLQDQHDRVLDTLGTIEGPGEPDPQILAIANRLFNELVATP